MDHPGSVTTIPLDDGNALRIGPLRAEHVDDLWMMFTDAVTRGEGYPQTPPLTRETFEQTWTRPVTVTVGAVLAGELVGAYYLKPNQPGLGAHIANAGYLVSRRVRGGGFGRMLVADSIERAPLAGFDAVQFNFVFESNPARAMYEDLGWHEIGRIPDAVPAPGGDGRQPAIIYWRPVGPATRLTEATRSVEATRDAAVVAGRTVGSAAGAWTEERTVAGSPLSAPVAAPPVAAPPDTSPPPVAHSVESAVAVAPSATGLGEAAVPAPVVVPSVDGPSVDGPAPGPQVGAAPAGVTAGPWTVSDEHRGPQGPAFDIAATNGSGRFRSHGRTPPHAGHPTVPTPARLAAEVFSAPGPTPVAAPTPLEAPAPVAAPAPAAAPVAATPSLVAPVTAAQGQAAEAPTLAAPIPAAPVAEAPAQPPPASDDSTAGTGKRPDAARLLEDVDRILRSRDEDEMRRTIDRVLRSYIDGR